MSVLVNSWKERREGRGREGKREGGKEVEMEEEKEGNRKKKR